MSTVAGIARDSAGVALTGTARTIRLFQNGIDRGTVETNTGTGAYSHTITLSDNDIIHVLFDGETELGATVTIASAADVSALDVQDKRVILANDKAASLTIADLDNADSGQDSDIPFTVTGGALTVDATFTLQVRSGDTFAPGGNVTVGGGVGSACVISGIWTAANGETLLIFGDFDCSGTYTRATTDKVTLRDETAGAETMNIVWGGNTFTDLEFNMGQSADKFAMTGNCTVAGQLTFVKGLLSGAGTTINAKSNIEVGTNISGDGASMPTLAINGTGAQTLNGTSNGGGELPNVSVNKPSGTLTITGTLGLGGNWTHVAGVVDPGTSTVIWNPAGSSVTKTVTMNGTAFNNLTLNMDQSADRLQLLDNMILNGNLDWLKGQFDLQNNTLKVAGDWDDDGTDTALFTGGSSKIEFNGSGAQSVDLKGDTHDTILVSNMGGVVSFITNGWTCANFQANGGSSVILEDGVTFTVNSNLTLANMTLRSNLAATQATLILTLTGTQSVSSVDVQDIDSATGEEIVNTNGTDSGNTTNWTFPLLPPLVGAIMFVE